MWHRSAPESSDAAARPPAGTSSSPAAGSAAPAPAPRKWPLRTLFPSVLPSSSSATAQARQYQQHKKNDTLIKDRDEEEDGWDGEDWDAVEPARAAGRGLSTLPTTSGTAPTAGVDAAGVAAHTMALLPGMEQVRQRHSGPSPQPARAALSLAYHGSEGRTAGAAMSAAPAMVAHHSKDKDKDDDEWGEAVVLATQRPLQALPTSLVVDATSLTPQRAGDEIFVSDAVALAHHSSPPPASQQLASAERLAAAPLTPAPHTTAATAAMSSSGSGGSGTTPAPLPRPFSSAASPGSSAAAAAAHYTPAPAAFNSGLSGLRPAHEGAGESTGLEKPKKKKKGLGAVAVLEPATVSSSAGSSLNAASHSSLRANTADRVQAMQPMLQPSARQRAEEAERLRQEAEEAERLRLVAEEAERLRLAAEEAERLRQEAEEAERLRQEAEEAERLRQEAEEAERLRQEAEEAERLRLAAEEAERLRQDAERLRQEAEEAERLRQDAERLRQEAEEAERLRQEAEEAERLRQEAEEAERLRQAAEEAERLRQEAERLRQEAEEAEEAERLRQEAERLRLAAEEAERLRQEAERLRQEAEEAERLRQEAEEAERLRQEAEEAERLRQEAEEAERLRLAAEEAERLRQEAEETERLRQEAEEAVCQVLQSICRAESVHVCGAAVTTAVAPLVKSLSKAKELWSSTGSLAAPSTAADPIASYQELVGLLLDHVSSHDQCGTWTTRLSPTPSATVFERWTRIAATLPSMWGRSWETAQQYEHGNLLTRLAEAAEAAQHCSHREDNDSAAAASCAVVSALTAHLRTWSQLATADSVTPFTVADIHACVLPVWAGALDTAAASGAGRANGNGLAATGKPTWVTPLLDCVAYALLLRDQQVKLHATTTEEEKEAVVEEQDAAAGAVVAATAVCRVREELRGGSWALWYVLRLVALMCWWEEVQASTPSASVAAH